MSVVGAKSTCGPAGAAAVAVVALGGSASMEYDPDLAAAIRQEQADLLTFRA